MTNLTDKWIKGELSAGRYWVKYRSGRIDEWDLLGGKTIETKPEIIEVLAPVPSYEEWEELQNWADFTNDYHELREKLEIAEYEKAELKSKLQLKETSYDSDTARLEEENTKLKELLKECRDKWVCYKPYDRDQLLKRIDKILANNKIQANTVACNKIQENKQ